MICRDTDDIDPFLQADNLLELGKLIEKTGDEGCSSNEFTCGDDHLPVCEEMDNDNWQSVFLDELTNDPEKEEGEEDSDDENSAEQEVLPCTKSYKEAIVALEDILLFLQQKGNTQEVMSLGSIIDSVCKCRNASTVQTTLDRFFGQQ